MDAHDRHVAIDQEGSDMDDHGYHRSAHIAKLCMAFSMLLIAIMVAVFVVWIVLAKQDSKLYEADGYVCASQPFAMQCWKRQ
jgi:hypothetical protein